MLAMEAMLIAAELGTKVGGEFLGEIPWGRPPGNGFTEGWGLRAPLELGLEVVLRSLGGGEFVLGGDAELPRLSILFDSFAAKHILNFVSNH